MTLNPMPASAFKSGSGWVLQSDLSLPELQAEINRLYQEEYRRVADHYGVRDLMSMKVPTMEMMNCGERHRRDWVDFVTVRDDIQPAERRTGPTKSETLMQFVKGNVGVVYTVQALAQAADCSESTVHKVISDNPGHFRKGMFAGTYELLDPEAERAREAAALAAPPSVPSPGRQPVPRTQPAGDPILALLRGETNKGETP